MPSLDHTGDNCHYVVIWTIEFPEHISKVIFANGDYYADSA